MFSKRHLICTIDDCIIPSTINCLRKDNKPSLRGPSLQHEAGAGGRVPGAGAVATPECTRVIIAGQHYDVDNTP